MNREKGTTWMFHWNTVLELENITSEVKERWD